MHQTKTSHLFASIMLAIMSLLLAVSMLNESAIVDELAHIPAGVSYVTKLDYRLNPEHPPLLKAISGLFVSIFTDSYFPTEIPSWSTDVNGQWGMGYSFLYEHGNNADAIIFWARVPIVLLTVFFGWLLYQWVKKRFGPASALFTLALFSFSPTVLAHSRYVTTDLGASFAFFIGIASFIQFLEKPTLRNTIIAGLCFGIAQLLKFSLVLLVLMQGLMFILWIISMPSHDKKEWLVHTWMLIKKIMAALLIAIALIWIVYGILTYNYPPEHQLRDTEFILTSYGFRPAVNADLWLVRHPLTRSLGHYLLGVLMVQQRAAGGNTAYFLGEVSAAGSPLYFPLLYLVKEPLPLHIFSLIAFFYCAMQFRLWLRGRAQKFSAKKGAAPWYLSLPMTLQSQSSDHNQTSFASFSPTSFQWLPRMWSEAVQHHFVQWSCMIMIAVYWTISIKSPLNIGIRHVLPTFPFMYILVARGLTQWIRGVPIANPHNWKQVAMNIFRLTSKTLPRYAIAVLLLFWLVMGTMSTTPYFLSFYNELGGGTPNGWKIAVDSNYDWGQDLIRLADFVEKHNIQKIYLDYFGGGVPYYYMGNKFERWWSSRGRAKGWFAISATYRQGTFGASAPGFIRNPLDNYDWLKPYSPVARAGYSIFIYKLPE